MNESTFDPIHKWVVAPAVLGYTLMLWGISLLELLTRRAIYSDDSYTTLYMAMMGSYVAGIEVQKWMQKVPADPANDPMVERMQRSGFFLGMWLLLLAGAYLARVHDHSLPMPGSLKAIATGLIPIFMAKRASRHVRHSRRGIGGLAGEAADDESLDDQEDLSVEEAIVAALQNIPLGLSFQELTRTLSPTSARQISRALKKLLAARRVIRTGRPHTKDVRYRLP